MSLKSSKILVFGLTLLFYGSFLVSKITLPGAQDLPRQMKNGEMVLQGQYDVLTKNVYSYIEPDQPFANHHWLYGVIAYLLHAAIGWDGMVVFKVIFFLLTFSLLFYTVVKKADFWLVALFSIPTIFILISRTALRPEIFSYFFVALFLFLLTDLEAHPARNRVFWLIPAQLLWVNIHLFFSVGIMLVAGFLLEKIVLDYKNLKNNLLIKKLTLLLVVLVGVIFINPYGLRGALFSLQVNASKDFPITSAEINVITNVLKSEPGWSNISAVVFEPLAVFLAISFVVAFIFRLKRKQPWYANNFIFYLMASLGTAGLGFFVIRGLPLFGLIFLPAIASNYNEAFLAAKEWLKNKWPQSLKIVGTIYALVLIFALVSFTILGQKKIMENNEQGIGLARWSESSANFFKDNNLKGPVFNDTDIGSYLIYYLYPKEKVFTDNRFGDAYSSSFFSDIYLPMIRDENKWKEGLKKYHFNTIFFYHYDQIAGARDFMYQRMHDAQWAWVWADSYAMILVKNSPENQRVIDTFQITNENVAAKLRYLADSQYVGDQLAAADLFNLIGRIDLSMPAYLKIVSLWPSRGKVWMVLGRTELTKADQKNSNPALAAVFLERAIDEGWTTWESYSYLALAYFRTGQLERAKAAVREELKVDSENPDGIKWLGILADEEAKQKNESRQ